MHPDVRRTLLRMRALTEAGRALALWVATEIDVAHHHPDAERRQLADDLVALLTPDRQGGLHRQRRRGREPRASGCTAAHGYITETGVEQLVRDARISQIYEGTNGVQALDLVGRKLPRHQGRLLRRFFHLVDAQLGAGHPPRWASSRPACDGVRAAAGHDHLAGGRGAGDREQAAAAATDYLRLFALTALASLWLRMAEAVVGLRP